MIDRFVQEVGELLGRGDLDAAQERVEARRGADPLAYHVGQAMVQVVLGNQRGYIEELFKAEAIGTTNPKILQMMASAHAMTGSPDRAEALIRQALEQDAAMLEGWQLLASLLSDQEGRGEEAAAAYEAMLGHAPRHYPAHMGLASLRGASGDLTGALDALAMAALSKPEEATPWRETIAMLVESGWGFGAMALVNITRDGFHEDDVNVFLDLLKLDIAVQMLGRGMAMHPDAPMGDWAGTTAELMQRAEAMNAQVRNHIALTFLSGGQLDEARAVLGTIDDDDEETEVAAETFYLRGLVASRAGDEAEALEHYSEALDLDPLRLDAAVNAATLLLKQDGEEALEELEGLLSQVPAPLRGWAPLRINEGMMLKRQGDLEAARAIFTELKDHPDVGEFATEALESVTLH